MNELSQLLSNEISYAIGWTIIHSLWQCTLIALLIAISYAFTKKASAATRYWINSLGLLSCVIASGTTFYLNYYDSVSIEIVSTDYITEMSQNPQQVYVQTISNIINQHINQIVMVWLIGFAFYISKYLAEFFYCQKIKNNHYKNPSQQWQQLFNELKNCVGITQNIQLRISEIVDVPCVIGHFKPVVLLPASLVLGLSIKQIEVILLHELGHIRRNDYLISGLQTLITLLYFFNPFARWISSKMDEERENACDDIAVAVSGDPLFYANTLKEFAEMKNNYSLAVAMTGRKNLLINRIKRLFIRDTSFSKTYGKAITIMAMFLFTIGYSVTGYSEEKKPTKETFSVKIENEPLSQLLTLAEQFCPEITGKVKLKHPDQIISGSFPDFECSTIEHVIRGMDNSLDSSLTGISINEKDISLKNLVAKIEGYCPETKGKIQLKNPNTLVGFKTENLSCTSIESTVKKMDADQTGTSMTIEKIDSIKFRGPDEYNKAFFKELSFPKEIVDKGFAGDCTLTLTVNTNGKATDITPVCISPNEEQKQYFENLLTETAKRTTFPIKMENENAVIAKGISIKAIWGNQNITEKPISSITLPKNESPLPNADIKAIKIDNKEKKQGVNNDFSVELSINKDINISEYNEIEFKPLFFGKKLIDTENKRDYRFTLKEFDFLSREFIALANKNFFASIRDNELATLTSSTGSKKLIGEVYIHKITPYWETVNFKYTGEIPNRGWGESHSNNFPFRANIVLGIILKDAESNEIVAVLKDQFVYSESRTGITYMSEKRKSRFIDETIISNIKESISKTTNGLIAYSQGKTPSADTFNYNENLVSKNMEILTE